MIEDLPAPLLKLKVLIWVHSVIGVALIGGLIATIGSRQEGLAVGVLACMVAWMVGLGSLRRKAEDLAPEDLVAPKGLPAWIPPVVAGNGLLAPLWLANALAPWMAGAWISLGATIVLRWLISRSLAISVHRKSWGRMLLALSTPLLWLVLGLLFMLLIGWDA